MRTSLRKLEIIERAKLDQNPEYQLLLAANIQLDPAMTHLVKWQLQSYDAIHAYGRAQLREDISKVEEQLFSMPQHRTFRNKILSFFNS